VKAVSEPIRAAHIAYPGGFSITKWWPSSISQRQVHRNIPLEQQVLTVIYRLGYPFSILTRVQFLRILYRNLKDRSKVHVNKRVVSIRTTHSGVSVFTADGGTYHGNLVVGADGVHSITRSEMWRIAGNEKPGLVSKEMSSKLSSYLLSPRN
jgi:FAD dependent monooxygenase